MTAAHRISPETVGAYLDRLDRADQAGAIRLAAELLDAGCSVAEVLVDLVAVAQREIGRRWLTGAWSVAQEHAATHVSELVVGAVTARHSGPADRGHVVMACVEGEWHALAARIVAEVVRAAGWRVTFLGASVPARHLVSYLHQTGPEAVLRRRREIVQLALRTVDPPEEAADDVATAVAHLIDALAAAIRVGDPQLLLDFVGWQDQVFHVRGGRPLLDAVLAGCETALAEHPRACRHLRLARSTAGPA